MRKFLPLFIVPSSICLIVGIGLIVRSRVGDGRGAHTPSQPREFSTPTGTARAKDKSSFESGFISRRQASASTDRTRENLARVRTALTTGERNNILDAIADLGLHVCTHSDQAVTAFLLAVATSKAEPFLLRTVAAVLLAREGRLPASFWKELSKLDPGEAAYLTHFVLVGQASAHTHLLPYNEHSGNPIGSGDDLVLGAVDQSRHARAQELERWADYVDDDGLYSKCVRDGALGREWRLRPSSDRHPWNAQILQLALQFPESLHSAALLAMMSSEGVSADAVQELYTYYFRARRLEVRQAILYKFATAGEIGGAPLLQTILQSPRSPETLNGIAIVADAENLSGDDRRTALNLGLAICREHPDRSTHFIAALNNLRHPEGIDFLSQLVTDTRADTVVRLSGVEALSSSSNADGNASRKVNVFRLLLRDDDQDLRKRAIEALLLLGPLSDDLRQDLLRMGESDPSGLVREMIRARIPKYGPLRLPR